MYTHEIDQEPVIADLLESSVLGTQEFGRIAR